MGKVSKNKRIGVITKILAENPNKIHTLNYFAEIFDCAKSTLSEDISVIEEIFQDYGLGKIESLPGASGGIVYKAQYTDTQVKEVAKELCERIKDSSRIIPGGYVYMNDIFYDPDMCYKIGRTLASKYVDKQVDYVVTIETKGIPLAFMVARVLNKPMIVVRKSARMTEGTNIQMNYITGSQKTIKTMTLAKRAIEKGSKVLFVDDFMKAGGTAKGIIELMNEFEAEVIGVSVVMTSKMPKEKVITDYFSLLELNTVDEFRSEIDVYPTM